MTIRGVLCPIRNAFAIACLLLSMTAQAEANGACPDEVTWAVAKASGMVESDDDTPDVVDATCKPWPHDPRILLGAFAFGTETEDEKLLVIAMVDRVSGRVIGKYEEHVTEDALTSYGQGSLRIDTAPYRLGGKLRAFGVRFTSWAPSASCPDMAWEDELSLFVPGRDTVRPVLRRLAMRTLQARTGCLGKVAAGEPAIDEAKLSIGLGKTSSHGFADLIVTAKIESLDEVSDVGKKIERHPLRYDGKQYRADGTNPWWLILP